MQKIIAKVPARIRRNLYLRIIYFKLINNFYKLNSFVHYGYPDMFHEINIETMTTCNRRCSYCPNSTFERGLFKNQKIMETEVFKKVIDELAAIDYKGIIAPHFYGEPILDKRLPELVSYAHKKLPNATIKLVSNGDFLSVERYKELAQAGVRKFIITQHSPKMSSIVAKLFEYFGDNPGDIKCKYFVTRREPGVKGVIKFQYQLLDLFYNRGGLVSLDEDQEKKLVENPLPICFYHSNPLVITYNGEVPLCCQDYNSTIVFGNVKETPLLEIWRSKRFKDMRKKLAKRKYDLPICKSCVGEDVSVTERNLEDSKTG